MAFEGPNEPNNFPITYKGQPGGGGGSWAPVAQFQEALYRAVKSDPNYETYPVFASRKQEVRPTTWTAVLAIPAGRERFS